MEIATADIVRWVGSLLWPLVRITSFVLAAPVFGARMVPVRVRLLLALLLAWLLLPTLPAMPAIDPLGPGGLIVSAHQVLLGVAMGFIFHLVFSAVVIAGQSVAMSMGLGFASAVDPQNGVQVPVVSQYYMVMVTLVFLALDGHLALLATLADSFHLLPVGTGGWSADLPLQIALWGSRMFVGALLMALPTMAALLLVNLAFGVMTRAAPQLNIFAVGFPITLLVGFVMLLFSLQTLLPQFSELFAAGFALLRDILR